MFIGKFCPRVLKIFLCAMLISAGWWIGPISGAIGHPPSGVIVECYVNDVLPEEAVQEEAYLRALGWDTVVFKPTPLKHWKVAAFRFYTLERHAPKNAGLTGTSMICG